MNKRTTLGLVMTILLLAGLASARFGAALATPQGDAPKPKPSASADTKEKPKAPKPEKPKKPDEGGW